MFVYYIVNAYWQSALRSIGLTTGVGGARELRALTREELYERIQRNIAASSGGGASSGGSSDVSMSRHRARMLASAVSIGIRVQSAADDLRAVSKCGFKGRS